MSSQDPDLEKISPPIEPPPINPDPKTEQESEEIDRRKALTAAQRADHTNSILIATFSETIHFHKTDCEKWEACAKDLQEKLMAEKNKEVRVSTKDVESGGRGSCRAANPQRTRSLNGSAGASPSRFPTSGAEPEVLLASEIAGLKEITHSISLFSWLAYLTTVAGAISVGVAGSVPSLTESAKVGFSSFGIGLTLVGLLCATYAHFKSKRADKGK